MYDKYRDIEAGLERAALEEPEPPSHALAREQLTKAGLKVERIIRADPDAIVFVNEFGRAMTAWSEVKTPSGSQVAFHCEAGMPAWPST